MTIDALQTALAAQGYIADRQLAVSLFVALELGRPIFLEGEAGVGKTALARALAAALDADLIRLQCYEGIDVNQAVYEWDYGRQMLEIRLLEASGTEDRAAMRQAIFSEAFLLKRPLLQAIEPRERPVVLLIDEIDRADEELEGYLLEVLSEYQITVPELGTIRAVTPPRVVLTSNRTREVHDALKRRCVYQWIEYPSYERELAIVVAAHPGATERLAAQVTSLVQELRSADLYKVPGISETLDWVAALVALGHREVDPAALDDTLGVVLKAREDVEAMRGDRLRATLNRALARGVRQSG